MMRVFLLTILAGSLFGCFTPPLRPADYTTPENSLLTFHNAFQNENAKREYECLSHPFKQSNGNLNLITYQDLRQQLVDENPVAMFLFSLQDLSDNILDCQFSRDGRTAILKLSVAGQILEVAFIRETEYIVEFDGGTRPVGDFLETPLQENLTLEKNQLQVFLPLARRAKTRFFEIRKILLEKRWKILHFSFMNTSSQPTT